MKKITLVLALTFSLTTAFAQTNTAAKADSKGAKAETKMEKPKDAKATVYVCDSKTAKAYHSSKTCTGLTKCSGTVKEMAKADAEKAGKTPCKMCNKDAKTM